MPVRKSSPGVGGVLRLGDAPAPPPRPPARSLAFEWTSGQSNETGRPLRVASPRELALSEPGRAERSHGPRLDAARAGLVPLQGHLSELFAASRRTGDCTASAPRQPRSERRRRLHHGLRWEVSRWGFTSVEVRARSATGHWQLASR